MKLWTFLLVAACSRPSMAKPQPPPPEPTPSAVATAEPEVQNEPEEHLLSEFTTKFKATQAMEHRVTNITLAASKIADLRIEPGEEFSFNDTVGARSEEHGFKNAPAIFMGELSEDIGGGTCQVSSTLFAAVLYAGVEVTDRRPHSRQSSYIGSGLDATVSYPPECEQKADPAICYDLKFKNNFEFPLHITAEVGEDLDQEERRLLTVKVFGTGEGPKVETRWTAWKMPDFTKRFRRISYWKNDHKRLKQPGQKGLEGARHVTLTWPDGHVEKREVFSRYKPVPEVWEVGMLWKNPEGDPK